MFHIKAAKNKKHSEFTMVSGDREDRSYDTIEMSWDDFRSAAMQGGGTLGGLTHDKS